MALITWDHTYKETIPEIVRMEFVSQAYSADGGDDPGRPRDRALNRLQQGSNLEKVTGK